MKYSRDRAKPTHNARENAQHPPRAARAQGAYFLAAASGFANFAVHSVAVRRACAAAATRTDTHRDDDPPHPPGTHMINTNRHPTHSRTPGRGRASTPPRRRLRAGHRGSARRAAPASPHVSSQALAHTCARTHAYTHTHTHIPHTHTHTHIHTNTQTHTRKNRQTQKHTNIHSHTRTSRATHTFTQAHTHTRTHAHARTHARTRGTGAPGWTAAQSGSAARGTTCPSRCQGRYAPACQCLGDIPAPPAHNDLTRQRRRLGDGGRCPRTLVKKRTLGGFMGYSGGRYSSILKIPPARTNMRARRGADNAYSLCPQTAAHKHPHKTQAPYMQIAKDTRVHKCANNTHAHKAYHARVARTYTRNAQNTQNAGTRAHVHTQKHARVQMYTHIHTRTRTRPQTQPLTHTHTHTHTELPNALNFW